MITPKRYDTAMRRRFDPDTRATVAIAASREDALRTLCTVVHVEFAGPSVPAPRVDMALQRLFRDYDTEVAKKSTQFPLAIWTQGMWTIIEDPRDSLPGDAVALSRIASILRTAVVARIVRSADETFGFSYHDDEKCRRQFLKLSGIIVEDAGRLDEEDPPIKKAPAECVDLAWGRLIPETEPEQIQVRLCRPLGAPE